MPALAMPAAVASAQTPSMILRDRADASFWNFFCTGAAIAAGTAKVSLNALRKSDTMCMTVISAPQVFASLIASAVALPESFDPSVGSNMFLYISIS